MKALQTIDSRVIDIHQFLVDHFDQKPVLLARHCIAVHALCVLFWMALVFDASKPGSWASLAFFAVTPPLLLCISLSPAFFDAIGGLPLLRLLGAALLVLEINGLMVTPVSSAIHITAQLAKLSFFYFAACRPPQPRVRREHSAKLAHSGGGA